MWKRKGHAPAPKRVLTTPAAPPPPPPTVTETVFRPADVLTPTIQADQLAWELAVATKPIAEWPTLAEDTLQAWETLRQANDPKSGMLIEKHRLITETVGVALATFERFIMQWCVSMVQVQELRMCANDTLFSLRSWTHVGTSMQAFRQFVLPFVESGHDRRLISDNEHMVQTYVNTAVRGEARTFVCDTALVKDSEGQFQLLFNDGNGTDVIATVPSPDITHRVLIHAPKHARQQTVCPQNLLLVIGSMLVPPCAASHTWKTLIVATGSHRGGVPHIVDRICDSFIGFGLTTDLYAAGTHRNAPYVLRIDEWKDTAAFKNRVHDLLKVGVIVVVRCTDGVPASIVQEPRLRLCTQCIRSVYVSDSAWEEEAGMLYKDAVDVYCRDVASVSVPAIPYRTVVEGKTFRPNPMMDGSMNHMAFYLAEMLHAHFGIMLASGTRVALVDVELFLAQYAVIREFPSALRKLTAEDVLEAAAAVREVYDDIVTYDPDSKCLVNIALCH